ncbi:hypothetical protein HHK36_029691 [Tetracentron sinense]|uniref:procollagen-proline 4-dioxygenase n=1 Tax=Tetracentron sinense TaxID=13715 RepID=A0A835CZK5_TETSI|nr:hypothetical protein HHK36_029691 [Tetracentron sinense]
MAEALGLRLGVQLAISSELSPIWMSDVLMVISAIVGDLTFCLTDGSLLRLKRGGSSSGFDPTRVTQLSWHPRAFIYKGFLSEEECDHLITLARDKLEKSMVADNDSGKSIMSEVRTSSGMFLNKGQDETVATVEARIAAWTFLPVENGEAMQILHYEHGEKYEPHFDYFHDKENQVFGGHRVATVLMYLSNVEKGGETIFPNSEAKVIQPKDDTLSDCAKNGYAVKPEKGDALLFFSLHPDATTDINSLHGSCPVIEGEKWSATKWIHVRSFDKKEKNTASGECTDEDVSCPRWAATGECQKNPSYMVGSEASYGYCRKSCKEVAKNRKKKSLFLDFFHPILIPMASSAKSSRSRAPLPATGGHSSDIETSQDSAIQLSDKLKVFKATHFDPHAYVTSKCQAMSEKFQNTVLVVFGFMVLSYLSSVLATHFDSHAYVASKCQAMSEKAIRHLCSYLLDLKKASAEEMRKSVYANYSAFIRTSKEISDLEGELLAIRNLLSTQAALVHGLAEGVRVNSLSSGPEGSTRDDISNFQDREPSKIEKWAVEFPDILEVLLAERRVDEALAVLDEGETIAEEANDRQTLTPAALLSLQTTISEQRQKLADQLAEAACQPSTHGVELCSAVLALKKLGDGPRAHTLLLNAHYQRYQYNMQSLRPSSASYGGAYTAALSQLVFSAIAQAASDSLAVFGEEPAYASELVTWSIKQTKAFALLVKRHALASSAASGGLRAAAECVQIALGHCSLLEARGLALCPVLLKLFRPSVEQALNANLKRIEESSAALATADNWVLTYPPVGSHPCGRSSTTSLGSVIASQPKLSSSAHRFNSMAQEFFEDVGPLVSMQLGGSTLEGLLQVFNSYVSLLINALPGSMEDEGNLEGSGNKIVRMAETEAQQMALLANASLLADELLPRAAMKLLPVHQADKMDEPPTRRASDRQNRIPEQREWKRRLQRSVDGLRDNFCRQHALDLIFTEDGYTHLSADMYISMDENVDEPEWFPSPIFQELFEKLTRMASIVTDMFVGRERFGTLLLMRLTETVILWLSDDQSFWEDIEEGPKPLGPLGLQQFYLDMEFVILFSSQGRYLSRHLHQVIKDIIARAMDAFATTGIDPYSVLPEDDWFTDVSQIAIKMLTGKARFGNVERDVTSPTASISARSISSRSSVSFRRQGSSGHIWNDRLHTLELKVGVPNSAATGRHQEEKFHEKEIFRSHSSDSSRPAGSEPRVQRCACSAVFGLCMGSPTTSN